MTKLSQEELEAIRAHTCEAGSDEFWHFADVYDIDTEVVEIALINQKSLLSHIEAQAAEIAEKDARIKELEGALKPFADAANDWTDVSSDDACLIIGCTADHDDVLSSVRAGHFRNAAKALRDGGEDG